MGLIFIALRKKWQFLVPLSALGTSVLQLGWINRFFQPESPLTAAAIFVAFAILYLFTSLFVTRAGFSLFLVEAASGVMTNIALGFGFALLLRDQPGLTFAYLFVLNLLLAVMAIGLRRGWLWHSLGGLMTFILLWVWTIAHLNPSNLLWALAGYFVFAALHAGLPIVVQRWTKRVNRNWSIVGNLYPVLMLVPILTAFTLSSLQSSSTLWLTVWLINAAGLAATFFTGMFGFAAIFLIMTFLISLGDLLGLQEASSLPSFLFISRGLNVWLCPG